MPRTIRVYLLIGVVHRVENTWKLFDHIHHLVIDNVVHRLSVFSKYPVSIGEVLYIELFGYVHVYSLRLYWFYVLFLNYVKHEGNGADNWYVDSNQVFRRSDDSKNVLAYQIFSWLQSKTELHELYIVPPRTIEDELMGGFLKHKHVLVTRIKPDHCKMIL